VEIAGESGEPLPVSGSQSRDIGYITQVAGISANSILRESNVVYYIIQIFSSKVDPSK